MMDKQLALHQEEGRIVGNIRNSKEAANPVVLDDGCMGEIVVSTLGPQDQQDTHTRIQ